MGLARGGGTLSGSTRDDNVVMVVSIDPLRVGRQLRKLREHLHQRLGHPIVGSAPVSNRAPANFHPLV
jgi:hypothetical protein